MSDRVLEVDDASLVDADDWASLEPKPAPLDMRAELQRQVDEFLAHGGKVQEFEPGESAVPTHRQLWSFPVGKAAAPNPVKRAQSEARRRGASVIRVTKHSDAKLVEIIESQLGVAKDKKTLREALGCSDSLLQRLLFSHFPNDVRADPYRQVSRYDREMARVKQIRQHLAEGQIGTQNIAQLLGVRLGVVLELDSKYGLKIPRQLPGRKGKLECSNTLCHAKVSATVNYCPQCGAITSFGLKQKEAAK